LPLAITPPKINPKTISADGILTKVNGFSIARASKIKMIINPAIFFIT
jgi:hypothetical protein